MQNSIVKALMDPSSYDEPVKRVKAMQTHISHIFLTGKYVYKVKKPVNFGFLDFTTLEKRKFFSERELELNRRLCGDMYIEVVPINESHGKIKMKGEGGTVEYALKMREMPQERIMTKLLEKNKVDEKLIDKIAKLVANFHSKAETGGEINEHGSIKTVKFNWDENFDQTRAFVGRTIDRKQFDDVKRKINAFIEKNKPLFERRIAAGKIRDCHGDFHSGNIFVTKKIYVFDCIEFNERFRCSDVAAEVAFFTMDLDFHGKEGLSDYFIKKYLEYSEDEEMLKLLTFYKCYRAYVRGKVASFELDDPNIGKRDKIRAKKLAARYFDLASKYARRLLTGPVLITMCGPTGTGKSFLADDLRRLTGAEVIKSDVVRKELAGIKPTTPRRVEYGKEIYSKEFTERTHAEMLERAKNSLKAGTPCVLDATFSKKKHRDGASKTAKNFGVPFLIVECICPEKIIRKRLVKRIKGVTVSDGRWEIYPKQKKDFEPIQPSERSMRIDTTKTMKEQVNEVLDKVDEISKGVNEFQKK